VYSSPTGQLYGAGPVTALVLTCRLGGAGRFSSARKAVRFTGLDITVYSSDGKRSPGHLSRQGPPVPRWCAYEAGKTRARTGAPGHGCYAAVKDRKGGKRAALSEARKIVSGALPLRTRSLSPHTKCQNDRQVWQWTLPFYLILVNRGEDDTER
jgi:hypothetical protein